MNETDFERELRELINRHSIENQADTPDFILAKFVTGCLAAFAAAVRARDEFWGFTPWGGRHNPPPAADERSP